MSGIKSTGIAKEVTRDFDSLLDLSGLTPRQADVLRMIVANLSNGQPTSVRDLQKHFGVKSSNGIYCHLKALAKKGRVVLNGHSCGMLPTGITITLTATPKGEIR